MINKLKHNFKIFKTWFVYILMKKKVSKKGIDLIERNYNFTPRERKLFERIKKIQGGNK